jgi:hypothetical protein
MLRKRTHASQSASEMLWDPKDDQSTRDLKRAKTFDDCSGPALHRSKLTAARQEPSARCDTCATSAPLSKLGLSKAPSQVRSFYHFAPAHA